jgi:hypothetical protein
MNDLTITGRIMYPHVHQPHQFRDDDNDPAYRCSIVIPQNDPMVQQINQIAEQLIASELDGVRPTPDNWVLKTEPDNQNIQGCFVIRPKSPQTQKPRVLDKNLQPILDTSQPADGDHCAFSIRLFAYNTRGNKGISAALNGVMLIAKGQGRLGKSGPPSDSEMFGSVVSGGQQLVQQQQSTQQPSAVPQTQPPPGNQPFGF